MSVITPKELNKLDEKDRLVVQAMYNFLTWRIKPRNRPRPIPPAVWAYMRGATMWCPPEGEM